MSVNPHLPPLTPPAVYPAATSVESKMVSWAGRKAILYEAIPEVQIHKVGKEPVIFNMSLCLNPHLIP